MNLGTVTIITVDIKGVIMQTIIMLYLIRKHHKFVSKTEETDPMN